MGRVAREFGGKTPLQLANEYGLIDLAFYHSLSPADRLFIDHEILNRLIQADNEARKQADKKAKDDRDHPGMERYESIDDFWDEAEAAKQES